MTQSESPSARKIRFILSRSAGSGKAQALINEIFRWFPEATHSKPGTPRERCGDVTISLTRSADDVRVFTREWRDFWADDGVVFIAGGDGSLNETISELVGSGCAFGVLPMGTGNDFARALYEGHISPEHAISRVRNIAHVQYRSIDSMRANGMPCVNMFSLGYDTQVLDAALALQRRYRRYGSLSFAAGVIKTLPQDKTTPLRFRYTSSEGEESSVEQGATVLTIGNSQYYGGGFRPLPHAMIDDGALDLMHVDSLSMPSFARLITKYRSGRHLEDPRVHTAKVTSVDIERSDGKDLLWNIDGIIHHSRSVHIEVKPASLVLADLNHAESGE
ncbi:MAG: diacylglycerol kinase family protein [Actinomycetaceae bacterium]|nr:hypothetical protein [Arcanobacterium sp.]MDD7505787.1 diacylglycerol kinase family protein [Actinomycetaceae bacterium]MDY6142902.1 diacylglycerol kinase family protein [Arcanobacterium sp.]